MKQCDIGQVISRRCGVFPHYLQRLADIEEKKYFFLDGNERIWREQQNGSETPFLLDVVC